MLLLPPQLALTISILTMVVSAILLITPGLNLGIDFTGGALLEITGSPEQASSIQSLLRDKFKIETTVQPTQDNSLIIRMPTLDQATRAEMTRELKEQKLSGEELRYELIGPTIGAELRRKSWIAVGLAIIVLVAYLTYTFRQMQGLVSSWKFGAAAVIAVVHDILVVAACFVILKSWGATVDTLFVTALLAILGYSVNDTIVFFNRFQQEWRQARSEKFNIVLDRAARATLIRSLNTSLNILLVLIVLLIFGGTSIRWFIIALTIGTVIGTYSTLYVAPPVLFYLSRWRRA